MAKPKPLPIKAPIPGFVKASQRFHEFARDIDSAKEPPEKIAIAHFQELNLKLRQGVDEAIAFLNAIPAEQDRLAGYIVWAQQRSKDLQRALEACEQRTLAEVEANPEHPYAGDLGKIASHKKGGDGKLSITGLDVDPRNRIKDPKQAFDLDIPPEFLKRKVVVSLDLTAVKKAIKDGKTLLWAHIEKGTRLSYPKWKRDDETTVDTDETKTIEGETSDD